MNDKHDKLVEMARECGCVIGENGPDEQFEVSFHAAQLAAFRSAILADAAKDVEPFWHAVISQRAPVVNKAVRSRDVADEYAEKCSENYPGVEVVPLVPASTLAAAQALNAELVARVIAWTRLYDRAINEANGLTNYVEDRPELRSAERRMDVIAADARALKDAALAARSGT